MHNNISLTPLFCCNVAPDRETKLILLSFLSVHKGNILCYFKLCPPEGRSARAITAPVKDLKVLVNVVLWIEQNLDTPHKL